MGVKVTTFVQDGKSFEQHDHFLDKFPSYYDMVRICKEDNIRADDFRHKRITDTFYVGTFIRAGGKSGKVTRGRRGLRFFLRCDKKPSFEDIVR